MLACSPSRHRPVVLQGARADQPLRDLDGARDSPGIGLFLAAALLAPTSSKALFVGLCNIGGAWVRCGESPWVKLSSCKDHLSTAPTALKPLLSALNASLSQVLNRGARRALRTNWRLILPLKPASSARLHRLYIMPHHPVSQLSQPSKWSCSCAHRQSAPMVAATCPSTRGSSTSRSGTSRPFPSW